MPDNFIGNFTINVMGATNNVLGQNGQGVCGVNINFDHEYVGDLTIVLTSPSGQSVQLIGPIGLFGMTDFTTWNIAFVPCSDPASPDPGFAAQWNNNQAWGMFGSYNGSYYPSVGCLENFNSGPVNGTWTLTVTDGQGNDVGNFFDYEVIFCDPSGILCFSCAANAGNLNQADVTACQGSAALNLNLPPTYTPPSVAPPAGDYSYTYVVAGAGGVILAYEYGPDLSGYDLGTYTVCGFSFYTAQIDLVPPPDGSLTVAQLSAQLAGGNPPFCGNISSNCVNVTILEIPPDEEETVSICSPDCYFFHNQNYCQSGTYLRTLQTPQGCTYTATLNLTVTSPTIKNLNETICFGECASTPGFSSYCDAGNHQEIFQGAGGCDSIVNLNLQVLNVVANIAPPGTLTCSQPSLQLVGLGSSTGAVTYLWTASNGGNIVGNTNGLSAMVNAPGDYQLKVCKTGGGISCCDSTSVTVASTFIPPAAPGSVTGLTGVCQGDTLTYSASTVAGAIGYFWTVPAGVVLQTGQNTQNITVVWNSPTGGNICAAALDMCDTSAQTCLAVSVGTLGAAPQPEGDTLVCAGTNAVYAIAAIPSIISYNWSVTGGGTIISGQGTDSLTVQWGNSPGSVCINTSTTCGNSLDACLAVNINSSPPAPFVLGPSVSCPGSSSSFSIDSIPSANAYNWQVTGGVINSGQGSDSIEVLWDGNVNSGLVCVNAANSCGNSLDSCWVVNLGVPVNSPVSSMCDPTNQFYTVSFSMSGGTAPYSVSGGTIAGGLFTSDQIGSGLPYNFTITDALGCVSPSISGSFNCNCSTNAGTMNLAPLSACPGETVSATALGDENLDGNDVGAFFLHSGSGSSLGTVFDQNTTGVFGFQAGMVYETTYYISYVVGDDLVGLPDLTDPCLSVALGQPVVFHQNPVANAGLNQDTCGTNIQLSGNTLPMASGSWAISSGNPANININNPGNPSSLVSGLQPGTYSLEWTITLNGCVGTDTVDLVFHESPMVLGLQELCDSTNQNYTVSLSVSGGTAPYSVNGNNLMGTTYVSPPISSGQNYTFIATDVNGCVSAPTTGSFSCSCATDAGSMPQQTIARCAGQNLTVFANNDQSLDGDDVTAYVLHNGTGASLGQVFAQNKTGIFTLQAGMSLDVVYYVSIVVGNSVANFPDPNDPCFSVAFGQPVIWHAYPAPKAGVDRAICSDTVNLAAMASVYPGVWSQVLGPGMASFSANSQANSGVTAPTSGLYIFQWTETNANCTASDQVIVDFNPVPVLAALTETCNGTNTAYALSFTVSNGTPPYTVVGINGSFSGSTFNSGPIANNGAYTFHVADANGCTVDTITGNHFCACATDAGTMQVTPAVFCANSLATGIWNNDASTDPDDLVQFVLHDNPGATLGNVFATSNQPSFSFGGNLQTGITYFISPVAGNNLAGNVDANDPCFSISAGVPVQWKPMPMAQMTGDTALCSGATTELIFSGNGTFPLSIQYSDGANTNTVSLPNGQAFALPLSPTTTSTFSLLTVSDGTSPTCSTALGNSVTVTVQQPVNAGTASAPLMLCAGADSIIALFGLITGADAGGIWTESSVSPSTAGGFNATNGRFNVVDQVPGTYSFQYALTAIAPCVSDAETVTVVINPNPTADAGADQTIDCDQSSVLLGGAGTSQGTYTWMKNGSTIASTKVLNVTDGGTYILTVENAFGCQAMDQVVVQLNNQVPVAEQITVRGIRCFGEKNGWISIDSVTAAHPPVLFSLNGGPFQDKAFFQNLEPGTYTVNILDVNGCESSIAPLIIEPALELLPNLGPDIEAILGDSVYLKMDAGVPISFLDTIIWQPLLDLSQNRPIDEQRFLPIQSWRIKVTVIDTNGCIGYDEVLIRLEKPRNVFIPNVFKPNTGLDPILYIYGGSDVDIIASWRIFDRWGNEVFEQNDFYPNDPSSGWDGTFKGAPLNPAVYVYQALVHFVDGQSILYKGDITLIR